MSFDCSFTFISLSSTVKFLLFSVSIDCNSSNNSFSVMPVVSISKYISLKLNVTIYISLYWDIINSISPIFETLSPTSI